MNDPSLSPELEKLVQDLKQGGLAFSRIEAAEKIGRLEKSHPRLVTALVRARESDGVEEVRAAAAAALQSPAHREILEGNPDLVRQALVEEQVQPRHSVFGLISFGLSLISILIIYADIFLIAAPGAGAESGGVAAAVMDISPLFCLSFLLSLVGLVLAILGLRQYGRKKMFSWFGLLGNGLIILCTLIVAVVGRFIIV